MYYVYILRSIKDGRLYKGLTENLQRRFKEHNNKEEASTRSWCPWELVYYAALKNKTDARREELFLKSGKGRERLAYLLKETLQ